MKNYILIKTVLITAALPLFAGCVERQVVYRDRPVYVEQPAPVPGAPPQAEVVVADPVPPPPQVEVIGTAPWGGARWVRGHYVWKHERWEWRRGHWA